MPVFNHLGVNDFPKREVYQDACLHWEGREESPRHSGLSLAPGDFREDENKILILPRGFCYAQKKENGGLVCTPSEFLSAKLPVSILVLVLMSVLFISLTIANPLLPQFFLSPPFPFLFTSVSSFSHRRNFIFKNSLDTSISWTLKLHFVLRKSWEGKKRNLWEWLLQSSNLNWHWQVE